MANPINNRPGCWPSWLCCGQPKEELPKIVASPAGKWDENGHFHTGAAPVTQEFRKEFEGK